MGNSEERIMRTVSRKVVWTVGLLSVSAAALADAPQDAGKDARKHPQEPIGFVTGGIIGGFAAGPVGAVVGAGLGTWLGERVHRAGDARRAEAKVAQLESDQSGLKAQTSVLESERNDLAETNRALTARLDELAHQVEAAQAVASSTVETQTANALDGLEGDVLFRTGSADLSPEMADQIRSLAGAVSKSPALKVRVDGYADPRGTVATNLKLSQDRADAVRDLFLEAGVDPAALEVNAYGKSTSEAQDPDGYALERRVRLTIETQGAASVAASAEEANPSAATVEAVSSTGS
jgi:outer membrane protein OmpA-like peptidoglycan-associated protein